MLSFFMNFSHFINLLLLITFADVVVASDPVDLNRNVITHTVNAFS